MKYLFIDTNNFMACALLTEVDHTPQTIDQLISLLDGNQTKLILPEIVEIEFFREVDLELLKIKNFVENLEKELDAKFPTYLRPDKDQYIKSAQQIYSKRKASSQAAKAKIKSLFDQKNVRRISLSYDVFINAYKRALAGKKPAKIKYCPECDEIKHRIDDDCIIFESILSIKSELENNELVFCSANHKDFAHHDEKQGKHFLHPELISSLSQKTAVKYYLKLVDALKAEFRKDINKEEKERINKYFKFQEESLGLLNLMAQLRERSNIAAHLSVQGMAKQAIEESTALTDALKKDSGSTLAEMARRLSRSPIEEAVRAATMPPWEKAHRQLIDELLNTRLAMEESVRQAAKILTKENDDKNKKK